MSEFQNDIFDDTQKHIEVFTHKEVDKLAILLTEDLKLTAEQAQGWVHKADNAAQYFCRAKEWSLDGTATSAAVRKFGVDRVERRGGLKKAAISLHENWQQIGKQAQFAVGRSADTWWRENGAPLGEKPTTIRQEMASFFGNEIVSAARIGAFLEALVEIVESDNVAMDIRNQPATKAGLKDIRTDYLAILLQYLCDEKPSKDVDSPVGKVCMIGMAALHRSMGWNKKFPEGPGTNFRKVFEEAIDRAYKGN